MDHWARLLAKTERQPNGCLHFTGWITPKGYGLFSVAHRSVAVHRFAFEQQHRPLEPGETVDHECHNRDLTCRGGVTCLHRRCIEGTHLAAKSIGANRQASMNAPANRAHCKHGHEFTPENTRYSRDGARYCRECSRLNSRAHYRRVNPKPIPRTHCRRGHELTPENSYAPPGENYVSCRTCKRERGRRG